MNISCRIANADTQCGRITNPPERKITITYGFHNYMKTTFLKPIKILKP